MKITAIKQQVKLKDRYSIFVDGEYSFSLGESALLQSGIVNGQEVDAAGVLAYQKLSQDDKLFGKVLRYATLRQRSLWEITDYLHRKEVADEDATKVIQKLSDYGYVNDHTFAEMWVQNRRLLKTTSRRKIALELQQKHVPSDIIEAALAEDKVDVDERNVIRELAERKRSRYADKQKLMQYLARQGFSYDDIKSVVSDL